MAKLNSEWVVEPHGPLERLDEGLYTVAGEIRMPLGRFPRRMTVVALAGGGTAVWSPVPLDDTEMAKLDAIGEPKALIVPGVNHRLDIRAWADRYPDAAVLCAPGARQKVEEVVPVNATTDVLGDPSVEFSFAPGIAELEAILWVRRASGTTLIVNDLLANVRHPHGLGAHVMARVLGFGVNHPEIPKVGAKAFIKHPAELAAAFRAWSEEPNLVRIVVSHGDVIGDRPAEALRGAADRLDS